MLVKRAFGCSSWKIKLYTRTDGNLYNLTSLWTTWKIKNFSAQDLHLVDDAALVTHSAQDLKTLLSQFPSGCSDFDLTINFKLTKVLRQETYITIYRLRNIYHQSRLMASISKMLYTLAQLLRQTHHWTHRLIVA